MHLLNYLLPPTDEPDFICISELPSHVLFVYGFMEENVPGVTFYPFSEGGATLLF
jgi:hypothetical protein